MPTYRIETPSGTFDIEADREPTHEEALAAISGQSGGAPAPAPQTGERGPTNAPDPLARAMRDSANSAPKPEAPAQRPWYNLGGVGSMEQGLRVPQSDAEQQGIMAGQQAGRAQAPYMAAMLVPGGQGAGLSGMLASSGIRAGAMGGAYLTNRGIEGEAPKLSEGAKMMLLGGTLIPPSVSAPMFSARTLANAAVGGLAQAATVGAGNYAEQAIEQRTLAPAWDQYKDSFKKEALVPAIIGAGAGVMGGKFRNMAEVQAEADAGKLAAAELGMKDPMLGDVIPRRYGKMQAQVVQVNPEMRVRQDAARAPIAKAFFNMAENAPQNEEIATQLQPIISKVDALDKSYAAAEKRLMDAQETLKVAKSKADLPPLARQDIVKGVTAETMAAISEQAKVNIQLQAMADTIGTQTGHAEAVQDTVKKVFGARSQAASEMLAATGIPEHAAIIGQNSLLTAAEKALGTEANTVAGKSILETIKQWGSKGSQDAAATQQMSLQKMAQKAAAEGRTTLTAEEARAMLGAPKGQLYTPGQGLAQPAPAAPVADQKYLTMDDFRRLRDGISDGFVGKLEANTNNMNAAERLAGKVYSAMSDAHVGEIARQFPDAVEPYNKFRAFWRDTSKIRDSDFGRALLSGEVSDSSISEMAGKLASGNVDEIKNFKNFVDLIKPLNKEVADSAMATMGSAVRNSFLQKAADESGKVDYRKLGNLLQSTVSKPDFPFPVEAMRLGDRETIAGWSKALRQFAPSDLTAENIRTVMESPQIQSVLLTGGKDAPKQLATQLAEQAFNKRVTDAAVYREAGMTAQAREALADAQRHATYAKLDQASIARHLKSAESNPLTGIFRGKGGYTLTNEAEKIDGSGTVTDLVANMKRSDARTFMGKLEQERPDLHDMVQRRLVANTLKGFARDEGAVPGELYNIDPQKVRKFFEAGPGGDTDTRLSQLQAAIGERKTTELKRMAERLSQFDDSNRQAFVDAKMASPIVDAAAFGRMGSTGSIQAGRSLGSMIKQAGSWFRQGYFNHLSASLLDEGYRNSLNRSGGDIADALSSLPAQKSYLLLQDSRIMNELGKKSQTPNNNQPQTSQRP